MSAGQHMPWIFFLTACLCVQLINSTHAGIQYPQVSFSSAKGGQQACDHIRQPRRLHLFQVSIKSENSYKQNAIWVKE